MKQILFILLCISITQTAQCWDGVAVGTGPPHSSSYRLIKSFDRLFRAQLPGLGVGLVAQPQKSFELAKAELIAGRLDLAILPLGMVDPEQIQVLAVLWKVTVVPFRFHRQVDFVGLSGEPVFTSSQSAVLPQAQIDGVKQLAPSAWVEALKKGGDGVYFTEVIGNLRVIKKGVAREIYPQDLSPGFSKLLLERLPWLEPIDFSYKVRHQGLGYTLVLVARADLDLELGNHLYRFLLYPPKKSWAKSYLVKHLEVKKTVTLSSSLQHKAIAYVKRDRSK